MFLTDIGARDVQSQDQYPLEKLNPSDYFGDKNKGFASTRWIVYLLGCGAMVDQPWTAQKR